MIKKLKSLLKPILNPVRIGYLKYLTKKASNKKDIRIVIGASNIFEKGWVRTEEDFLDLIKIDHWKSIFRPNSIKAIIAEHVWEHLDEESGLLAFENCYIFLKPGGYLRLAIPDGFHKDPNYINMVKPGGTGNGASDHKILYNYKSLSNMLEKVGFKVKLLEWFDEKGKFNRVDWEVQDGKIRRSIKFDSRNVNGNPIYTSLIVDAVK